MKGTGYLPIHLRMVILSTPSVAAISRSEWPASAASMVYLRASMRTACSAARAWVRRLAMSAPR